MNAASAESFSCFASAVFPRRFSEELNHSQYSAVTTKDGPVLVSAGPGTGKTRVLVYRVAWLLDQGVSPSSILMLTFTNSAAREMLSRAAAIAGRSASRLQGGTFHSVANWLLSVHGHLIGLPKKFIVLDRSEAEGLIAQLRSSFSDRTIPPASVVLDLVSAAASLMVDPAQLALTRSPFVPADFAGKIASQYALLKRERNLLDFDDLLSFLQRLLQESEEARQTVSSQFSHVLVDEYQDTNAVQEEILRLLAPRSLFVVGDHAQAVYAWRGAQVGNILGFPERYPGCAVFHLRNNYRSLPPIVRLSNAIFPDKELATGNLGGSLPVLLHARDEADEARQVASRIVALIRSGVPPVDIAVLFRSSRHAVRLEAELSSLCIPFVKRGGLRSADLEDFRDMLAFFRVLANPKDGLAWTRIFMQLAGVGAKTAASLTHYVLSLPNPFVDLSRYNARPSWNSAFFSLCILLRSIGSLSDPSAVLDKVLSYFQPFLERRHPDDRERCQREAGRMRSFASAHSSLSGLVEDAMLSGNDPDLLDAVGLFTIHAAKCREWRAVFVIGLTQGLFPDARSASGPQLEEERRLFYVACTRAKQQLCLSWHCKVMDQDFKMVHAAMSCLLRTIHPSLFSSETA